jgi:hypothetical protein
VKQILQTCCLGLALVGLLTAPAQVVHAQDGGDPAVVVALGNLDSQMKDIKYLMNAAGQGGMYGIIEGQSSQMLAGLDRKRPMGAMLWFSEESPEPKWLAFIPVSDLDGVLDTISNFGVDFEENGDNIEIITPDDETIFVRESAGYALVTDDEEMLGMAPANPAETLASVSPEFNVGARLFVQRIPESLRQMVIDGIESGYREQMDNIGDEDLAELQKHNFEMQMAQIRSMVNETEELTVGLNIDESAKSIHLDMQMIGQDGSELARQASNYASAKPTRFGAMLTDEATMSMGMTGTVAKEDAERMTEMFNQIREMAGKKMEEDEVPEADREIATRVLNDVLEVIRETVEAGTMDAGAMAMVNDDGANLVAGLHVVDPARLEESVREVVEAARDKVDGKAEFNLDMATHDGVRLHEIVADVSEEEDFTKLLGSDKLRIYLGVGSDVLYLGVGNDPLPNLKTAISDDGKSSSSENFPMQWNMHLAPILAKVADMQDEEMPRKIAAELAKSGRDRIRFIMKTIDNGFDMKFEAEDGIIQAGAQAAQQMGGMMGPGADF